MYEHFLELINLILKLVTLILNEFLELKFKIV